MRAQAAVLRDRGEKFQVEDVDLADPGPGEVLVKIAGTGVCHSDLLARTFPPGVIPLPTIFGHEGAGVVVAVGAGVSTVGAGDHVVLTFDVCGHCGSCLGGEPAYCTAFSVLNMAGRKLDGTVGATDVRGDVVGNRWFGQSSFSSHSVGTERNVVKVDPNLPLEILGPLGCGLQTGAGTVLRGLRVGYGSSIAIFGVGAVGMAALMAAKVAGASTIIAVDIYQERRELSLQLGATHAFDGRDPDLATQLAEAGKGLDFAVDTSAVGSAMKTALSALGSRGHLALVGVGADALAFNPTEIAGRHISYFVEGDAVPQVFIPQLIELWQAGRFPFDRLIQTYPLADINRAIDDSLAGVTLKPVLLP
jgi:aryl-alcohol dehydrogenase